MAPNRMGGLVRFAAELEREGHVGDVPSSGMGQAVAGLSGEFGRIGAKIGALADHAASVEGREAGRLAGLDPEFRATGEMTIRGEAYDQAGLQVAETRTRTAMLADMEAAFDQHGNDPAALNKALTEKRAGWIGGVDPKIRPDIETSFDGAALRLTREAQRAHVARIAAEQKGAMTTELGEGLKELSQNAYALGLDAQADAALEAGFGRLERVLGRTDPTGKRLVSPQEAAQLLLNAKQEIATARIQGAFGRLESLSEKAVFITQLRDDFASSRGIAAAYDFQGFDRVVSGLESDYRSARAGEAVGLRALSEDIKSTAKVLEKGFDPGDEAIATLKGRLASMAGAEGAAELGRNLAEAEGLLAFQKSFRTQTPEALEAWLVNERKELQGGEAEAFRVERLEAGERLLANMRTELKQDPNGWADRVGLIKLAPLDFTSAETAGATMKARIAQAEEIGATYGQAPVYLRPDEKRALSVAAAQGGEQMLQITSAIAASAGARTPKVIAEISESAPVVALIAGHVALAGPTDAARDAADGIALMKTDGFKSRAPSAKDARLALDPVLGRALSDLPAVESTVINAANAIYEVRAQRNGWTEFDPAGWTRGLNEILGQRVVNGVSFGGIAYQETGGAGSVLWPDWATPNRLPVVLPPSVRSDGLDDLLQALNPDDFTGGRPILTNEFVDNRPRYADGSIASVAAVRGAKLKNAGQGRYFLAVGDPEGDDPQWLVNADGQKYVLELDAMLPDLARRRPDLVLGGQ